MVTSYKKRVFFFGIYGGMDPNRVPTWTAFIYLILLDVLQVLLPLWTWTDSGLTLVSHNNLHIFFFLPVCGIVAITQACKIKIKTSQRYSQHNLNLSERNLALKFQTQKQRDIFIEHFTFLHATTKGNGTVTFCHESGL